MSREVRQSYRASGLPRPPRWFDLTGFAFMGGDRNAFALGPTSFLSAKPAINICLRLMALGAAFSALAAQAHAQTIRVSSSRSTGSSALYIALERGYFKAEGLDAQLIYFDSAQAGQVAVVSGDTEVGMGGMSGTFFNLAAKNALKIIAGGSREMPGFTFSSYVVSNKAWEAGLREPKNLVGKTVGLTTVGSIFSYTLQRLADKHGFAFKDMRTVPLQTFSNIASAIRGGSADVGTMTAPSALPLIQRGEAKVLAWMADETPFLSSGVFTSAKALETKRDTLAKFMRAWRRGAADFVSVFQQPGGHEGKPEAEALITIIAKHTKLEPAEIKMSLPFIDAQGRLPMDEIRLQVETFKRMGMVDAGVTAEIAVDASLSELSSLAQEIEAARALKR
jgi:NitT/TauT family transport system substrate-binding protein